MAAERPRDAWPFGSIGEKGAFLSHLAVLREARDDDLRTVLILEDDAQFAGDFLANWSAVNEEVRAGYWDLLHLGHLRVLGTTIPTTTPGARLERLEPSAGLLGAHCYAVQGRCLDPLIKHFERQSGGVRGDDLYGPMPSDGTLSTFARTNPQVKRYVVIPSLCRQRSSRSDISPRLFDRVPVVRQASRMWRVMKNRRPGVGA
ncbi:MAG: glycosyltransferase family 25 protein [Actinomycetota bacterium]|nr:glycosyltransferase family 25 protein [Actinomycetota bacterium]